MTLLGSSIIFSQGSLCSENVSNGFRESAFDAVRLLHWTANYGIMPCCPGPLICPEIRNHPPQMPLIPEGSANGVPGASYSFLVQAIDPDGDQLRYTFNWGDETESSTPLLHSGLAANASHNWSKAGRYRITAMATDSKGALSPWSAPLEITINMPPDKPSAPSGPGSIYAWSEYAYSSFASDPDGDEVEYTFDWGDKNTSRTNLTSSAGNASAVHSWSRAGDYRIRVIARDRWGAASNWSEDLTVTVIANNKPNKPTELFGPSFGYKGLAHSYFTMAKDVDGDNISYSYDWGDGASSSTKMVESGCLESASHTWVRAGCYQVLAKATDSKGASSGWINLMNVTIRDNDPPNSPIPPSGPTSGRRMMTYKYATSANDPDGDPVKYVFDWGDKTTSWTGLDFIDSGKNESVSHKWGQAGTYQVKAMALDDKGATSGWSSSLIINISSD